MFLNKFKFNSKSKSYTLNFKCLNNVNDFFYNPFYM